MELVFPRNILPAFFVADVPDCFHNEVPESQTKSKSKETKLTLFSEDTMFSQPKGGSEAKDLQFIVTDVTTPSG